MVDVDVFVGNNTLIDAEVYQLWLNGLSAQDASVVLQKRGVLQRYGVTLDLLLSDTQDHFRIFSMLERMLHSPSRLSEQLSFQITADSCQMLIKKYYDFDEVVIREIFGKKLSARNRNGLDDISDKTRVSLRSIRRQFDNVKRVFKIVEDMPGFLVENIMTSFLLPEGLAKQYAAIVFISNNRFETSKKKLSYLNFDDFVQSANILIKYWSCSSSYCVDQEDSDVELDREFLIELQKMKTLLDKDLQDEHKKLVLKNMDGKMSPVAFSDLEANYKNYAKTIISIGYGLNHNKEIREFFLNVVEKLVEPFKQNHWTHKDVTLFIEVSHEACVKHNNGFSSIVLERYMLALLGCITHMYHS